MQDIDQVNNENLLELRSILRGDYEEVAKPASERLCEAINTFLVMLIDQELKERKRKAKNK